MTRTRTHIRAAALAGLLPLLAAAGPAPELRPPFAQSCISSPFGAREGAGPRASRLHGGIDIPAPAGAWVQAAAAGEVVAIRRRSARGLEVDLRHPGGWVTRYAHLGTVVPALAGGRRQLAQGERLGRVGRSGITYGTHLHFELLADGERIDPAARLPLPACGR
ncbi:M23 family metallopeptidase [Belnapia sp. T6]|uniref:M23 family metallopeptidase n=1 Tax=Belnapia mucosa TaxID=2804532 RepID=A0ABS1UW25_9PROT|nr:M23 family metallopeptidase [Belnapia mucosa]MBL6453691.1 M23 family metallopeptidase [Belnapia mucosa]